MPKSINLYPLPMLAYQIGRVVKPNGRFHFMAYRYNIFRLGEINCTKNAGIDTKTIRHAACGIKAFLRKGIYPFFCRIPGDVVTVTKPQLTKGNTGRYNKRS